MSIVRKIAKNTLSFFAAGIVERVVTFFVSFILIRYLGSGEFGKYSLVYAFLSFFQVFSATGIDYVIFRELSRDQEKGVKLLGNAITLKFLFSLIGVILCWMVLRNMSYTLDIKFLIFISSLGMLVSFGTLFNQVFQAKLATGYVAAITVATKVLLAICSITLIFLKANLFYFILLNLLIYVLQLILAYYFSRGLLRVRMRGNFAAWKQLLQYSWPLIINAMFVSMYTRFDHVFIFSRSGNEQLGFYAAAVKLIEVPLIIVAAFLTSIFPILCKYAVDSPEVFKRVYEIGFKYIMIAFSIIATMAMLFSKQIILVCYGSKFIHSHEVLAILIWATLFTSSGIMHDFLLLATNQQHLNVVFTLVLALVNLALNLVLIPRYGILGAAFAAVISYSMLIPLSYSLKKTRMFARAIIKSMIKPVFAALVSGCAVYFIPDTLSIMRLILGIVIYFIFLVFIKEFDARDIKYVRELFKIPDGQKFFWN